MKKNVLREYLKNREKDVAVFEKDKFFTFTVDDIDINDGYKEGAIEKLIKKSVEEAKIEKNASKTKTTRKNAFKKGEK